MNNYTSQPYYPDVEFSSSHTNQRKESIQSLAATFQYIKAIGKEC